MRIDGRAVTGKNRAAVSEAFTEAYGWPKVVDRDELVNVWSCGQDCVDLLIGGELWVVSDTDHHEWDPELECEIDTAIYQGEPNSWICNRKLFELVFKLTHLPSIKESQERTWKKRWFELGSRQSLECHLAWLPACARPAYVMEHVDGETWGLRLR